MTYDDAKAEVLTLEPAPKLGTVFIESGNGVYTGSYTVVAVHSLFGVHLRRSDGYEMFLQWALWWEKLRSGLLGAVRQP